VKKLRREQILGQQGANLVERIVNEMGHIWRPTTVFDTGVDGEIELRNSDTNEVTGCYIKVQVKAGSSYFKGEVGERFTFTLDKDDLEYWTKGTAPVILVVCRPESNEAYWVSLREYVGKNPQTFTERKIHFNKKEMRFTKEASRELLHQMIPSEKGIYFPPRRVGEVLQSNLIRVKDLPPKIFVARTEYRAKEDVWAELSNQKLDVTGEWMLKDKCIFSFIDPETSGLKTVIEGGSVETIATSEWAFTDDDAKQRDFVQLLGQSFKDLCYRRRFRYNREYKCYGFSPTRGMLSSASPYVVRYQSFQKKSKCMFFKCYRSKKDSSITFYYRHLAFQAEFRRFERAWFVVINPTYLFTYDGKNVSRRIDEYLSTIKRIEHNSNVVRYVRAIGQVLQRQRKGDLFDNPELLKLEPIDPFEIQFGLDDRKWFHREDVRPELVDAEDLAQMSMVLS